MTDQPTPRAPEPGRWRKKPVVIEARQWDGTASGATPLIDWMLAADTTARYHEPEEVHVDRRREYLPPKIAIDTLEGVITASPGDWIIRGVQGEFYPCKPDIFEATYESADATPEPSAPADLRAETAMVSSGEWTGRKYEVHRVVDVAGKAIAICDTREWADRIVAALALVPDNLQEQIEYALLLSSGDYRFNAVRVMDLLRRNGMVP